MLQQAPPDGVGPGGSGDDVEASPSSSDEAWPLALPIRTFSLPGFSDRRLRCVAELPPSDADLLWEGVDTTGRKVWLGSEQLLHWLAASASSSGQAEDREAWRGQSVIELGCGAGLVGLFVSQLGVASYTYSDGAGETVELARANVQQLNGSSEGCVSSRFVQLAWGEAEAAGRVVAEQGGGRGFDRVLACDVIYDRGVVPLLMRTAAALLAPGETSEFLLSYVSRCVMPEAEMVGLIYQHAASQGLVGRHVAAADLRIADWRVRQELVEADAKLFAFKHRPGGGGSVPADRAAAAESTEPR